MKLGQRKVVDKQILAIEVQPAAEVVKVEPQQPVLFDVPAKLPDTIEQQMNYKVDDAAFWNCMRRALGNCSKAARYIKKDFDIDITRQAVAARANRNPELLEECKSMMLDTAEEVMMNLLLSSDKKVAADIAKFILKTQGRDRGFVEKVETSSEVVVKSVNVHIVENNHSFATDESEIDD